MPECPICSCDVKHVNNHVRMSSDDDHGAQGTYPDGYDTETRDFDNDADDGASNPSSDGGQTVEGLTDEEDEDDAEPLRLEDDPAEAREYECGECGTEVPYMEDCPDCGEELQWQGVSA